MGITFTLICQKYLQTLPDKSLYIPLPLKKEIIPKLKLKLNFVKKKEHGMHY